MHPTITIIIYAFQEEELSENNVTLQFIESLLCQNISIEIICINCIPSVYSSRKINSFIDNDRIKVVNQIFSHIASIRNYGLRLAKGKYVLFLDQRDRITEHSLLNLYEIVRKNNPDIIIAQLKSYNNLTKDSFWENTLMHFNLKILFGSQLFIYLMQTGHYLYFMDGVLYKKEWLINNELFFYENDIYERELWTSRILCSNPRTMLTSLEFYSSRKRKEIELGNKENVISLFCSANELFKYSCQIKFDHQNKKIKSWIYTRIYQLYAAAFMFASRIHNSTFILPPHYLYSFFHVNHLMQPDARSECKKYYLLSKKNYKEYLKWRLRSNSLNLSIQDNKKIILLYNKPSWFDLEDVWSQNKELPTDFVLTIDRKYIKEAYAVVFHLPDLHKFVNDDMEKQNNQIWVAWNMECEINHTWMMDPEIKELFDIQMNYHPDADIPCLYHSEFKDKMFRRNDFLRRKNKVCMFISSHFNLSERFEYIHELMQYIEIDSYGSWLNNKKLKEDKGIDTKLDIYSKYKFVIAFENAVHKDYVTEKLYDPLIAGAVPIYLGAPNVRQFLPGDNCFINVQDFSTPKELSLFLNKCYTQNDTFLHFHEWRKKPFNEIFLKQDQIQSINCVIRLCQFINENFK